LGPKDFVLRTPSSLKTALISRNGGVDLKALGIDPSGQVFRSPQKPCCRKQSGALVAVHHDGPQAGEVEVIIPELPAMPDNITFDGELFWMAAFVERDPILDWVHPRSPAFKRLLARLPLR